MTLTYYQYCLQELVGELESRQMTLDNVARKVEALIQDLPRKERDMVEKWVSAINTDHQRVYGLAMDKQKLLAENIGHRELFQASLERVNMWLQTKERDANKLEAVRYHSSEAEKQLEKCKVSVVSMVTCDSLTSLFFSRFKDGKSDQ